MIFHAPFALLPEGWRQDVLLSTDTAGTLIEVTPGQPAGTSLKLAGPVLPGFANLHSHAFQRALLGRTQVAGAAADSFWTWREAMYALVDKLEAEDLTAIAAQAFVDMLKGGYTTVCEFHYLHRRRDGGLPFPPQAHGLALLAAARDAGMALTLLPALYANGDFGDQPLLPRQGRFKSSPDEILGMFAALRSECQRDPLLRLGLAPHSLRAVSPGALRELLQGLRALDETAPIHLHVAEQRQEVEGSIANLGQRPVAWLLDHFPVGPSWCLVHATHLAGEEIAGLARSGAVAGLCPSTEADLGDGFFPLAEYLCAGGRLGIGSDGNLCSSVFEELRWLEYGQRLRTERRNIAAVIAGQSVGANLVAAALAGGAQAAGQAVGALAAGKRADFLVLDGQSALLLGQPVSRWLDALVFGSCAAAPIREVYVAARRVIADGRHEQEAAIGSRYARAMQRLGELR